MKKLHTILLSMIVALTSLNFTHATTKKGDKPNIVVIWGDDIGQFNLSFWNRGQMGYQTPNIDKIGEDGVAFTDYYGEQSCTAGRAAFLTGQSGLRTGLTKVGLPGADLGMKKSIPTIAAMLKREGYATAQYGKNHLGDQDHMLPTNHGFDEFYGNLYHLNAEEEPEHRDYPKYDGFKEKYGPRGVIHSFSDGRISDTGPLTKKRMETVDLEFTEMSEKYIAEKAKNDEPFFLWVNFAGMHLYTHPRPEIEGLSGENGNFYTDAMVDHDRNVGRIIDAIEKAGISDNTIVMYSTDNGPHFNGWPDGAVTPYRGEKNTNWEGGYRVPCMIKWPNHIPEGQIANGIVSHLDWAPTLLAAAGNENITEELKDGIVVEEMNNRKYRGHLDGYNMLPYLQDVRENESPREDFFYFNDDQQLVGMRYNDWKVVFMEQRAHGMAVWSDPFVPLRFPKIFNLRRDPYEKADTDSNGYWNWVIERIPYLSVAQDRVGKFLATFKEYPPAQKAASFSIDQVIDMIIDQGQNVPDKK